MMRINRFMVATLAAVAVLTFGGCMKKSPEQLLEKAYAMIEQNDTLGARLECQDIVKKFPTAPEANRARFVLASIYAQEQQPDEAMVELKTVLDGVSQKSEEGQEALQMMVGLEMQRGNAKNALALIDGVLDGEAKGDEFLSQGLLMMKSAVLQKDGQTTPARDLMQILCNETTATDLKNYLNDKIGSSYLEEKAYDEALSFFNAQIAATTEDDTRKFQLMSAVVETQLLRDDVDGARAALVALTEQYDKLVKDELDLRKREGFKNMLVDVYVAAGNYKVAQEMLERDLTDAKDEQLAASIVQPLFSVYMRQGNTSGILEAIGGLAERFPDGQFGEFRTKIEETLTANADRIADMVDTRTLTMKINSGDTIAPKVVVPAPVAVEATPTEEAPAATTTEVQ